MDTGIGLGPATVGNRVFGIAEASIQPEAKKFEGHDVKSIESPLLLKDTLSRSLSISSSKASGEPNGRNSIRRKSKCIVLSFISSKRLWLVRTIFLVSLHAALSHGDILRFTEVVKSKKMKVKTPYFSVDHETWLIAQKQKEELFHDDYQFRKLRTKMQELEKNKINFIPSAYLLTSSLIRKEEPMDCRSRSRLTASDSGDEWDLEGLHLTGKHLLAIESTLKNAKDFYASCFIESQKTIKLQTDIKKYY